MQSKLASAAWFKAVASVLAALAVSAILYTRVITLLPRVMPDEFAYSNMARHDFSGAAGLSTFLFARVYSVTSMCGQEFYSCARVLNIVFMLGFAAIFFLVARKVTGYWSALLVTGLALIGPIGNYVGYFMPESMFFFSLAVLFWFILRLDASSKWTLWAAAGAISGVTSVIKPHGLFIIPGIVLLVFVIAWGNLKKTWMSQLLKSVAFVATAILTKLVIGFAFAGTAGLVLLGSGYQGVANNFTQSGGDAATSTPALNPLFTTPGFWLNLLNQLWVHFGLTLVVLGFAVFIAIRRTAQTFIAPDLDNGYVNRLSSLAVILIANMIVVVGLFSSISSLWGGSLDDHIIVRYYEYLLPFVLLTAYAKLNLRILPAKKPLAFAIVATLAAAVVLVIPKILDSHLIFSDASILGLAKNQFWVLPTFALVSVFSLVFAIFKQTKARKLFAYALVPALMFGYTVGTYNSLTIPNSVPGIYNLAARYVRDNLTPEQKDHLYVVGAQFANVNAMLFVIDDPQTQGKWADNSKPYFAQDVPAGTQYLLLAGGFDVTGLGNVMHEGDGFVLLQVG